MGWINSLKQWFNETALYKSGHLYDKTKYSVYGLLTRILMKVEIDEDHKSSLRELGKKGLVIYALKHKSQLECLILRHLAENNDIPLPSYCHGINMSFWQPFSLALKAAISGLLRRSFKKRVRQIDRLAQLESQVTTASPFIIHLGSSEFFDNPFVMETLTKLISTTREKEPVFLVPTLVIYHRRRLVEEEGILGILFGQEEHMGPLRRLLTLLRFAAKTTLIPGEPIEINAYREANRHFNYREMAANLREELLERIDEEKAAILGPVLKSRSELINITLQDESLQKAMQTRAAKENKPVEVIANTARKHLSVIAADYNEGLIEIWARFLNWLWNNIYDGLMVDREGMAKIRQISKKMPFVIIPCHRSHIDYLVLSYVFYRHKIQMPFVAAGDNLSFWPIGYLFRKSGAFFLRRTFRGGDLYPLVFSTYIKTMLKEGLPLEFFIEGGRSRTGKMVMPKYGLLSMILQAYQDKACDDLALVPVYIGYDKVVEEKSYLSELSGAEKEREKTTDVLKSGRILRKRFGRVYVNVGEAITLKSYLAAEEANLTELSGPERQSLYRKISYETVLAIQKVSVVTPFSLVAAGLLSHDRRGIAHDELMEVLDSYYEYLHHRQVNFAATFANRQRALIEALNLFHQSATIARIGADEDDEELEEAVYSLEEQKRLGLEYYKNNILHYFLPLSFIALSILANRRDLMPVSQIMEDYQFFKRLFRHEFIFDDRLDTPQEVSETLAYLNAREMVFIKEKAEKKWIEITGSGRVHLGHFSGLIHNYIESCWIVIRGTTYLKRQARHEKEFMKKLLLFGNKLYRKGEIMRAESLSQANYTNALRHLRDEGIVNHGDVFVKGEKSKTPLYTLGDPKKLEELRRRLFRFL